MLLVLTEVVFACLAAFFPVDTKPIFLLTLCGAVDEIRAI
jgi:hypothetical protein